LHGEENEKLRKERKTTRNTLFLKIATKTMRFKSDVEKGRIEWFCRGEMCVEVWRLMKFGWVEGEGKA
jgi:hypothetical protein